MDLTLNVKTTEPFELVEILPMDNRSQRVECIISVPLDHEKSEFPDMV